MEKIKEGLKKIKECLEKNKLVIRHYLVSSFITFTTGFLGTLLLVIDEVNIQSFETGAWIGLIGVGLRAGIKALIESWLRKRIKDQYDLNQSK